MDILYLLIPFSALLVLAILVLFAWALRDDQFDDLDREGARILEAPLDAHQPLSAGAPEQSRVSKVEVIDGGSKCSGP